MSGASDRVAGGVERGPPARGQHRSGQCARSAITALGGAGSLGLTNAREVGGAGLGLDAAAEVVEALVDVCGSTAMVVLTHYAATAVIEQNGLEDVRRAIAAGRRLTTLAFSKQGSRSHFWVPQSTATSSGDKDRVRTGARGEGRPGTSMWVSCAVQGAQFAADLTDLCFYPDPFMIVPVRRPAAFPPGHT
ncbi:acyl-CoA dehydrogenase family protein [Salinispora arenicola]|nr:acyl-CoA dehydrogenase family protein [Salinispora arenicola]